jgi:hypothetical protein
MNAEEKKERVRQYYSEVWCNGRVTIVDELFASNYENCDPATPRESVKGREAFPATGKSAKGIEGVTISTFAGNQIHPRTKSRAVRRNVSHGPPARLVRRRDRATCALRPTRLWL